MLGNLYEYRSVKEIQYLEKARSCYEQALSLISADDSSRYAEKRLNSFYDFTDSTTGHPIYSIIFVIAIFYFLIFTFLTFDHAPYFFEPFTTL